MNLLQPSRTIVLIDSPRSLHCISLRMRIPANLSHFIRRCLTYIFQHLLPSCWSHVCTITVPYHNLYTYSHYKVLGIIERSSNKGLQIVLTVSKNHYLRRLHDIHEYCGLLYTHRHISKSFYLSHHCSYVIVHLQNVHALSALLDVLHHIVKVVLKHQVNKGMHYTVRYSSSEF